MMKSRKNTPDIMGNLMQQESNKEIKQEDGMNSLHENGKSAQTEEKHKAIKPASHSFDHSRYNASSKAIKQVAKEKATFNLPLDTLEALEEAWIKLRRKLKGEQRVTKTLIVEKAIEIALADLEAKSELSELYLKLKDQ